MHYPFVGTNKPPGVGSTKLRRTQSFSQEDNGVSKKQSQERLITPDTAKDLNSRFSVLNLDLKLGSDSSADLVQSLERDSVAQLLDGKIAQSIKHLENLHARISDTSSKVLVTGDLNAGKSTLVNALLRREVMPCDQQPCTTLFCEVLDARKNGGIEEVHAITDVSAYNRLDPSTYVKIDIRHLYKTVTDGGETYTQLKVYCTDRRDTQESLLHNGVVDIALIDCPGLNIDSMKTTKLFARQEEIDVVVFVVSAENHFTLSAKEFLWSASHEKAYIFIVVNRFDNIRDKDRCKRLILEQIRNLSPATFDDAEDLVHFVCSNAVMPDSENTTKIPEFDRLEQCLRSFVLEKRSKSKLAPAERYLDNILTDVSNLAEANRDIASRDYSKAFRELEEGAPVYRKMLIVRDHTLEYIDKLAEDTCADIQAFCRKRLEDVLTNLDGRAADVEWSGFLYLWQYAQELRDIMVDTVEGEVSTSEQYSKDRTAAGIATVHNLTVEHLKQTPEQYNLDGMYTKHGKPIHIPIEISDFFDFDFNDKLNLVGVGSGALMMLGGKMLGYKQVISSVWKVSNVVGFGNIRRWAVPLIGITGFGVMVYFVSDMRHAVSRKVARKIRHHLRTNGYVDYQTSRITRKSRKALRISAWDMQNRFQKEIETQEKQREEQEKVAKESDEAHRFFAGIVNKADEMAKALAALSIDLSGQKEHLLVK